MTAVIVEKLSAITKEFAMFKFKGIPQTENTDWGFYGTMNTTGGNAEEAWPLAFTTVKEATGCSDEEVLAFLDSRAGRHFADSVWNYSDDTVALKDAVKLATEKWMGWTIGKNDSKEYGIPVGTPYLTGHVVHAGMDKETAKEITKTSSTVKVGRS